MNRFIRHILKLLIALMVTIVLCIRLWPTGEGNGVRAERSQSGQPVRTLIVNSEAISNEVISTGTVRASESIDIQVETSGKIIQIAFSEGSLVSSGDLLIRLDDGELRAQLRRATSRRDLADRQTRRLSPLASGGAISKSQFDVVASELEVLEAEIEVIEEQLARREVLAPFDGVIGLRFVSEGAYVTPATRIATFQNLTHVKIDFSLPEKYSALVAAGQVVEFSVTGGARSYEAKIYAVEPRIEESTRTLLIRAEAENLDGKLRPGAFARVVWQTDGVEDAILIPAYALMKETDNESVYVVRKGKVTRQIVSSGLRYGERIQIRSGLSAGDEIVIAGTDQVRPQMHVSIIQ